MPAGIYLLKVKIQTLEQLASFWCLYCQLETYFTRFPSVSVVNFEHVIAGRAERVLKRVKVSLKSKKYL